MDNLTRIEQALSLSYPESFRKRLDGFHLLVLSPEFQKRFPHSRLALDSEDVNELRNSLPDSILPFMLAFQGHWTDVYGFQYDSATSESRVVVWSDHAVVEVWPHFTDFLNWIYEQVSVPLTT